VCQLEFTRSESARYSQLEARHAAPEAPVTTRSCSAMPVDGGDGAGDMLVVGWAWLSREIRKPWPDPVWPHLVDGDGPRLVDRPIGDPKRITFSSGSTPAPSCWPHAVSCGSCTSTSAACHSAAASSASSTQRYHWRGRATSGRPPHRGGVRRRRGSRNRSRHRHTRGWRPQPPVVGERHGEVRHREDRGHPQQRRHEQRPSRARRHG
jgi:hypothetical protein